MTSLKTTINMARGLEPAELVLKNGFVFHAFTGEFIKNDVALNNGKIIGIGSYNGKKELDMTGKYLTPGFIDAHVHIESSMLTPEEFASTIAQLGTTTIIADPHEIANVTGLTGIQYFLDTAERLPINLFMMLPSCVPATNMETSGAILSAAELASLIKHHRVLGLGEMMNYPGVLNADDSVLAKLALAPTKFIDGHAPSLTGKELMAYAAAGISSDHECIAPAEALAKLRAGMQIMLREGSAARNLENLLPFINQYTKQFCSFATDDRHTADLLTEGHINYMVRTAVRLGIEPAAAIQMATINTARHYNLRSLGAIAPGYQADIAVFDNLIDFKPVMVFHNGRLVTPVHADAALIPPSITNTMHLAPIDPEKLKLRPQTDSIPVIGLVPQEIVTQHLTMQLPSSNGEIIPQPENDILKLVVFERHAMTGNIAAALVKGFGLKKGAIASTVAHDSHNLIVIGTNDKDIILAAQTAAAMNGGLVITADEKILGTVPLPIAGLMSPATAEKVKVSVAALQDTAYELGVSRDYDPFITLSFLSLPVIPSLKLTDKGLVDVDKFAFAEY